MRNILKQRKATVLQNQKGFTLVEMLIVLVLIGLAVSMMVGIFGNPFANASTDSSATRVIDDLRSIEGAAQAYKAQKATNPTGISVATTGLVETGYLKLAPTAPSPIDATTYAYTWDTTNVSAFGTAGVADTVVTLGGVPIEICQAINKAANGAAVGATPSTTVLGTKNIQCYGATAPYTALIPVFAN